jgi:CBS-domain-containing membrane protein
MHAIALFLQSGQHTLPVIDASTQQVVGVLRLLDLLRELVQSGID